MNFYELIHEHQRVLSEIEDSGGEIDKALEDKLDLIAKQLAGAPDKADFVLKKLDSESDFYSERIKEIQGYKKSIEYAAQRLKEQIKRFMTESGKTRLTGECIDLVLKRTKPSVVIEDESKLPTGYIETVITSKINKTKLYEDLKLKINVSGARLEESFSLSTTRTKK